MHDAVHTHILPLKGHSSACLCNREELLQRNRRGV